MFFLVHLLTQGRTTKKERFTRSLYSFDYGVCLENNLGWGDEKNVIRQQRFAYDGALSEFDRFFQVRDETEYVCPSCGKVFAESDLMVGGARFYFLSYGQDRSGRDRAPGVRPRLHRGGDQDHRRDS